MSTIELRPAVSDDGPLVWQWRNDPLTRRMFRTGHVISWQEHAAWFAKALQDSDKVLLIAQDAGGPIGVVRFDSLADRRAEVSIHVNPQRRGQGLGRAALAAACGHAFGELGLTELYAEIKADNAASMAIFTRAGFAFQGIREGLSAYRLTQEQFRKCHPESVVP